MNHRIDAYSFGRITIDGTDYENDVMIVPSGVKANWWRKKGHEISVFDIAEALTPKPSLIIIGTGASGACKLLDEVEDMCESLKIELIAVPTPEAVVEYNSLEDKEGAVCALHLTC